MKTHQLIKRALKMAERDDLNQCYGNGEFYSAEIEKEIKSEYAAARKWLRNLLKVEQI